MSNESEIFGSVKQKDFISYVQGIISKFLYTETISKYQNINKNVLCHSALTSDILSSHLQTNFLGLTDESGSITETHLINY